MPYREDILIEKPEAQFNPDTDIQELIDLPGVQAGGGDTLALGNGEAVIVYLIDWLKARSFARWALGFAYADRAAPYKLYRENPAYHPRFPQLTASTVHFSGVAPKSDPLGTPAPVGPNQGPPPNYPAVLPPFPGVIPKTTRFDKLYATVRFVGQRPWQFLEDLELQEFGLTEADRYTHTTVSQVVELLTVDGGASQVKWSETSAVVDGVGGPALNGVVANTMAERLAKARYLLRWMWVPEEYLSNRREVFHPRKLFACAGRVNSVPFLGFPAGTVLCDAPLVERFEWPTTTFDGYPFYGVNVTIPLTHFEPDLGVPDTNPADNAKARGHRCLPWRANGKWYGVKRENGSWYIPETDLNKMFQHVAQP